MSNLTIVFLWVLLLAFSWLLVWPFVLLDPVGMILSGIIVGSIIVILSSES